MTEPDPQLPDLLDALDLLGALDAYCDLVPRADTVPEEVGPFTLFVSRGEPGAFDYYARPRLGLDRLVTVADVTRVLERQRERGVPPAVEWIDEVTPSLEAAARGAGMAVERCPLLVLDGPPSPPATDVEVRVLAADDPELAGVRAAVSVGFAHAGTAVGPAGVTERDDVARGGAAKARRAAADVRAGRTVVVGALVPGAGVVGGGSHRPRGDTTEVVGVGVLPAYRRRGAAGAVAAALAHEAREAGVTTVFCGAQDDDVARVYERVGFRRVGTACIGSVG